MGVLLACHVVATSCQLILFAVQSKIAQVCRDDFSPRMHPLRPSLVIPATGDDTMHRSALHLPGHQDSIGWRNAGLLAIACALATGLALAASVITALAQPGP
jgi:hypothetical protein